MAKLILLSGLTIYLYYNYKNVLLQLNYFFLKKGTWHIIGIMSGTSLDGLDMAYVRLSYKESFTYRIIHTETIPYPKEWQEKLQNAFHTNSNELQKLTISYGKYIGEKTLAFINKYAIKNLDFIASHGHTIFHKPSEGCTLQIGDGRSIAKICNKKVVNNFRVQDVALGGQGAPLVPIGDRYLFANFDYCLNIGGFSNISFENNNERIAYDVCPANIVLNHYARKVNLEFDDKGSLAKSGKINDALLQDLSKLNLYNSGNSMGYELVAEQILPLIDSYNIEIKDVLRTFTEHIAQKISENLKPRKNVLITGGGAYNCYLIQRIKNLSGAFITIPNQTLIEYKEALIFALLGLLKLQNEVNCLSSVTKAIKNHSSGFIHLP